MLYRKIKVKLLNNWYEIFQFNAKEFVCAEGLYV